MCDDAVVGRRGNDFKRYWHDRQLELPDGDTLRWLVIDSPDSDAWIAYYRCDRRGGLHPSQGVQLLRAAGHPDADLEQRTDDVGMPLVHSRPSTGRSIL